MTGKNKTILTYCILILLAAAIIASGRYINSKKSSPPEEDYAKKLAELKTNLIQLAKGGSHRQDKRTSTGKSPKARST